MTVSLSKSRISMVQGLAVQATRNGKGIFALRAFQADEVLYEVTGEFLSGDADEDIDERVRDNAFRFSVDAYINPAGSIGDFQNHACTPNAKVVKHGNALLVVARGAIIIGDEILIDYSTITGADDIWEMACNCGSDECRSAIRSFDTLPKELQETYTKEGMISDYILDL